MAACLRFVCDHCGNTIESWDEGNPYYLDEQGKKRYAYHPEPERDRCIGVESASLCLSCGSEFKTDSRSPVTACPACSSADIVDTFALDGHRCPACKAGVFRVDSNFFCIS